jgi:hypothetical protein
MDWAQVNKIIENFTNNFNVLSTNIVNAAGRITDSTNKLTATLSDLDKHLTKYSESSDSQATAMKILTGTLVVVGLLQIFVPIIYSHFDHQTYIVCVKSDQNTLVCDK